MGPKGDPTPTKTQRYQISESHARGRYFTCQGAPRPYPPGDPWASVYQCLVIIGGITGGSLGDFLRLRVVLVCNKWGRGDREVPRFLFSGLEWFMTLFALKFVFVVFAISLILKLQISFIDRVLGNQGVRVEEN